MGKRKKKRRGNAYRGKKAREPIRKKSRSGLLLVIIVGALAAGSIYMLMDFGDKKEVPASNPGSVTRTAQASSQPYSFRETRPALSPILFVGAVSDAYRIAKEIPEVLDQLYCYCRCAENFGHKSLLSCYADRHAST